MMKQTLHSSEGPVPVYEVVWPLGRAASEPITPSSPVSDLTGKTVGELWDWLFRGDEMFPIIRDKMRQRYSGIKFVDYTVFGNTHGSNEAEVIAALTGLLRKHRCDLVISAVGA